MSKSIKGSYCKNCHTYFQLRRKPDGSFSGICPRCGRKAFLDAGEEEGPLFVNAGAPSSKKPKKKINVWDHYASGRIIATLEAGTPARVLATHRYNSILWYKINVGQLTGWVSGSFVRSLK